MSTELVPNPPSPEMAKRLVKDANSGTVFKTTPLVRQAIINVCCSENYPEFTTYFMGGVVTGSNQADMYAVADKLVGWEADAKRTSLHAALADGEIRLVDIVKRLAPELRKVRMDVQRGVIVGTLIGAEVALASPVPVSS